MVEQMCTLPTYTKTIYLRKVQNKVIGMCMVTSQIHYSDV